MNCPEMFRRRSRAGKVKCPCKYRFVCDWNERAGRLPALFVLQVFEWGCPDIIMGYGMN